jgi:soluble lytic murein transglycosylase
MQTRYAKHLLLSLLLFACHLSMANDTSPANAELNRQRLLFQQAEKALEANDLDRYQQTRAQLDGYPLLPYLDYQETILTLEQLTPDQIRQKLSTLSDTPLANRLLDRWLGLLADEGLWHSYLSFSRPGGSVVRQCQRLRAFLETGKRQQAFDEVPKLWLSGTSRPEACDPVFDAWIADDQLTEELVWQRVELALQRGKTRLATYLKRFLPSQERLWVEKWVRLYNDPARVEQLAPSSRHPMLGKMITQSVRRLAWRDVDAAYANWVRLSQKVKFSDWQHLQVARSLMGQLARQESQLQSQQISDLLPKQYLHLDTKLADKQLQHALQNSDWQLVLLTIDGLPKREQAQDRWRYWKARALIRLERKTEGEKILKALSGDRSYYGFLAAQRVGDQPKLSHKKLEADPATIEKLARHPALQRARELHLLGRSLAARREWNLALHQSTDAELRAAARLAEHWDWPSQVILTLTRLRQWNDLELRFPLAHKQEITTLAKGAGIDKAWVYAILRQESAFMQDAKSSVGARGLMQLMPKTAKSVAGELQLALTDPDELYQPEMNLKLGTGYLNKVFRRLQENPVLATAAYNAGPWRVESWLPKKTQAADIWIETVPYRETREYLKRVLAYTVIYNYRLGEDPSGPQALWMQPIEAPADDEKAAKPLSGV